MTSGGTDGVRPSATYRLQLHRGFGFADARRVAPYLARLGVSHVYLSPITTAVPGSEHGYDVIDPTRINPDLGGERAYLALCETLRGLGLGQVVDIVPNHMAAVAENRWWDDVLRRGPASPYARLYDIDWRAANAQAREQVVLAVLGDPLEEVLARGELTIEEAEGDEPRLRYFDRSFPLAEEALGLVSSSSDREGMRALLAAQHYRLEYWRAARARVNYRRFFMIDALAGVRVEDPTAFALTHALALRLLAEGRIDGLRIDHVDGLVDPAAYLATLRRDAAAGAAARDHPRAPYVVVEKILAAGEALPAEWSCDGTTGYDFMRDLNGVFVDSAQEAALTRVYTRWTGQDEAYERLAYAARRAVVDGPLATLLRAVAGALYEAAGGAPRDVSLAAFEGALRALLAAAEPYRTYHTAAALDPGVRAWMEAARERAADLEPGLDANALALATEVLAQPQADAVAAVARLQQLMPTVQAKGIEDCAGYRYARLLSLSEVGSSPGTFGLAVDEFHRRSMARRERWPASMLATATHDQKRGEDVRARLNVLSEIPEEWGRALERWHALTAAVRPDAVDGFDEYVLHQTLVGAWPVRGLARRDAREDFTRRVQDYLVKYARERGVRTRWDAPDEPYEAGLRALVARVLDPARSAAFLADRDALQQQVSRAGAINSLAQVALKVCAPGVPDTYQGCEAWDLSLVDPDNRRPVDYEAHVALLERADAHDIAALLAAWEDGAVKVAVLSRLLRQRRAWHPFYLDAAYAPLEVSGDTARHVVAFARTDGRAASIVVAARLPLALPRVDAAAMWSPRWGNTQVRLGGAGGGIYRDVLSGARTNAGDVLAVQDVLGVLPVAVLASE